MMFTRISAFIFVLISLCHLLRPIYGVEVMADDIIIPFWPSVLGFVVPLFLAIMMFRESKSK